MRERFQEVYRLGQSLYEKGSPVIICNAAIQKDVLYDKLLCHIKFESVSLNTITACSIRIDSYDITGNKVEGVNKYSYLDLCIKCGDTFGAKIPIYLPDIFTRKIEITVLEVVYEDGTIWTNNILWDSIPEREMLIDYFKDEELVKQFKIEAGVYNSNINFNFLPQVIKGLYRCACGADNMESVQRCYRCQKYKTTLLNLLKSDELVEKVNARLNEEKVILEQQKIENEKKSLKKKKQRILIVTILTIFLLVLAGYFLIIFKSSTDINGRWLGFSYYNSKLENSGYISIQDEYINIHKNGAINSGHILKEDDEIKLVMNDGNDGIMKLHLTEGYLVIIQNGKFTYYVKDKDDIKNIIKQ